MLTISEAMNIIRSGTPFNIEFCSADAKKQNGGFIHAYAGALPSRNKNAKPSPLATLNLPTKQPNHTANSTINIRVQSKPHPVKVHIYLIMKLNGEDVI